MLQLRQLFCLGIAGAIYLLEIGTAKAQSDKNISKIPITNISQISDIKRPHTNVKEWLAQQQTQIIQVTGVSLNQTSNGLEVILETTSNTR